jgi:Phosphotransferase enzyme family
MNLPPADPLLPQLPTALNAQRMAEVFATALNGPVLETCTVERIKYRPQRTCSVSYRLQLRDDARGAFEQRVSARFCAGGDARRRHAKALGAGDALASPAGPALQHAAELDMLAWWLPNDPQLPGLRLLCDAQALRGALDAEAAQALGLNPGALPPMRSTLVQVVPERRACARVDVLAGLTADSEPLRSFYVKCHADERGALTHARMQALSASPAQRSDALRTPRSLLWQPVHGLHWQAALPGMPLQHAGIDSSPVRAAAVGAALAALHLTSVPWGDDASLSSAVLGTQAEEAARVLAAVDSHWSPQLARVLAALKADSSALSSSPMSTLHGDLHPNNVLVSADDPTARPGFIDMDSLRCGPAALELGGWLADAAYRTALAGHSPERAWPACEAFLEAYAAHGGAFPQAEAVAWGAAYQLLCRRAYGAVANLKPGRLAGVQQLLARAVSVAESGSVMSLFEPQVADVPQEAAA